MKTANGAQRLWREAGPLGSAIRACRAHLVYAAVFSCLINILYLSPTLYMMQVYDRVIPTNGRLTLVFLTIVLFAALASLTLLEHARTRLLIRAGLRLERRLAPAVLDRMTAADRGNRSAQEAQATRELDTLRQVIGGAGVTALFDAPWTPVYLLVAFLLHPLLGALTLAGAIALSLLAVLNERATRDRLQTAARRQAAGYARQETLVRQAEVVRALGMRRPLIARQVHGRNDAASLGASGMMRGASYASLIRFLRLALQSLALGAGAWLAISGQMSAGSVIAASVLLSRALQPVEQLVGGWGGLLQARVALSALDDLFGTGEDAAPRTQLPDPRPNLAVQSVRHALQDGERDVLVDVSLHINAGEVVGIIGPSGAGKSTLARLIAGAIDPEHGVIRIDGAAYRDWDRDLLARHIGYLPQDPALFEGTVRDNISRFEDRSDAASVDAAVIEAAKAADVHNLILKLPLGYDTRLGASGSGLSSGQTQRVALARALYRSPVLLVLDEPNAHLDGEGEVALNRAISTANAQGATILVIAHRMAALAAVSRLIVLKEGSVEMDGPRDAILSRIRAASRAGQDRPGPSLVKSDAP